MDGLDFKHHGFPTHFPVIYSPLIFVTIFFPNIYTLTMLSAVYFHLFADTFFSSDGIKWLYPLKDKFYSFLSENIRGKHGIFWEKEYKKTPLFKFEFVLLAMACLFVVINHLFYYQMPIWQVWLLGGLLICFYIGFIFVDRARFRYIQRRAAEIQSF